MKKRNLKGNNKGFTLVELIVVLVILAILAAILVPALLGYIDSARNKQTLLNARSAMVAAQAEMSAIYGSSKATPDDVAEKTGSHNGNLCATADFKNLAPTMTLFEVGCDAKYDDKVSRKDQHKAFTISWAHYKDISSEVWFDGADWVETAPTAPTISWTVSTNNVTP